MSESASICVPHPPDRPVAVAAALSGQRHAQARSERKRLAPLLLLLALGAGSESCVVPQQIQQYQTPPAATLPSPQFDIASADVLIGNNLGQSAYVVCLDDTTIRNAEFQIPLADTGEPTLDVRWFVNYDLTNESSWQILNEQFLTPGDAGNYKEASATAQALQLLTHGIYSVEVVACDQFDPEEYPQNRQPAHGHYAASYKWIVNYLSGTSACGEP